MNTKFLLVFPILLSISCSSSEENHEAEHRDHDGPMTIAMDELDEFQLTFTKPEMKAFSDTLKVRGMMHAPPMSKIDISLPYGGIIEDMRFYEGARVKKGELLAVIKHPDYVDLQERYIESISLREKALKNLNRQKSLDEQESTPRKILEEAESQFRGADARYNSLKAKLRLAGLSPGKIEDSGISDVVNVYSPSDGTISEALANNGMYLDPNKPIYRIIDKSHLHLELAVFPGDIGKIEIGQLVYFTFQNSPKLHSGKVYLVSQNVSEDDRSIKVHVHPDEHLDELMPGMFVAARLITQTDSAYVIPNGSFKQDGNEATAFVLEGDKIKLVHFDADSVTASGLRVPKSERREFVADGFQKVYARMKGSGATAGHSH